ncbi:MAG: hypothetical protein ACOX1P_25250 [Thermoguttaceae bacterium]
MDRAGKNLGYGTHVHHSSRSGADVKRIYGWHLSAPVYTRKDACNENVIRWRSPLWMAQVDPETLRLRRDTERIVLPLVGDGVYDPDRVAIMGNFHTTNVTPHESWVTVGEWQPKNGIRGDLLLARIHWSKPNTLVT